MSGTFSYASFRCSSELISSDGLQTCTLLGTPIETSHISSALLVSGLLEMSPCMAMTDACKACCERTLLLSRLCSNCSQHRATESI